MSWQNDCFYEKNLLYYNPIKFHFYYWCKKVQNHDSFIERTKIRKVFKNRREDHLQSNKKLKHAFLLLARHILLSLNKKWEDWVFNVSSLFDVFSLSNNHLSRNFKNVWKMLRSLMMFSVNFQILNAWANIQKSSQK